MEEKKLLSMEDKYYIPNIEDFYVGYEYEFHSMTIGGMAIMDFSEDNKVFNIISQPEHKVWYKESVTKNEFGLYERGLDKIENLIKSNQIRTKYLDKQDIESLGWEYIGKSIDLRFKKEGRFERHSWTARKIKLHYGLEDNWLFIHIEDNNDEFTIFEGICPSINELKTIMKLLNIPL